MESFFSFDKFNVTLCLEYNYTYLLNPSTPPPPVNPSPSFLYPI